ncbi:MAG: hypothetical protein ABJC13_18915 [Acidobacteriota bacterium]
MLRRHLSPLAFVFALLGSGLGRADEPTLHVRGGTVIRRAPKATAPRVAVLAEETDLPRIGQQGAWVEVRWEKATGWVSLAGLAGVLGAEPLLGSAPEPTHPVAARKPDPERLARARGLLGSALPKSAKTGSHLGPYPLLTNVAAPERIAFLDRTAGQVETAYRERYGRTPIGAPAETVLLFENEGAYRVYQDAEGALAGAEASGHSGYGLVAIWDGGRPTREIAETLVHEIVHLLNRRAIGPQLPPWLDEGIADDLAHSKIGDDGALDPSTLGGTAFRAGGRIQYFGAKAALRQLVEAQGEGTAPSLPDLFAMPWETFVAEGADLHYAQASFFVRYLLGGENGTLAPGLRAFLNAVADGGEPSAGALEKSLGKNWPELEAGFRVWVVGLSE